MPDDQWYAVDIFRDIFLADAGDIADETRFFNTHTPYGDISNSHLGQFAYPLLSAQPYASPAIMTLEAAVLEPAMEDETGNTGRAGTRRVCSRAGSRHAGRGTGHD